MSDLKNALHRDLVSRIGAEKMLDDDTELFSSGLIDSLGVMDLISFIEGKVGCGIMPADITLENFDSIARIVQFVERLIAG
ncbi:MAG: hypothetical protein A2W25_09375 [candidate division Zixibacteria bacterium RBG_16_53_22]|nr:MAG: hypothetical protein A2W25_09375 [candidate division Zixibacteria bacterium RBG_16_53_22]